MKKRLLTGAMAIVVSFTSLAQEANLALKKPVFANSENDVYPVKNLVDGKITRHSKWMSANVKPPHIVEIDLQYYCNISKIIVHTGIPEAERTSSELTQAAGFWSAKNFKLQYWDDANWTDMPNTEIHENRLTHVPYSFNPVINTYKIRFVCDDGEPIGIMEIEVFGEKSSNTPVPSVVASDLEKKKEQKTDQDIKISINKNIVGRTFKYVGYNQGYYMPGSNVSGWLEYSHVNSLRVWATLNSFVPATAVQVDKNISSVEEFDRRKKELRQEPEHNQYLKWDQLTPLYDKADTSSTNAMVFNYALQELKRLKIDVILQMGSNDFDSSWSNKWKQWQRYYALAFHAAKTGDVQMFAMQNEPNHRNSGPMKLDQWIMGMQIVSDAIHCAVADVNRLYDKNLQAKMVGPVTAGNNPEWWAAVVKNVRTDYHGNKVDKDLMEIFSTHSYNSPAAGYESRVNNIRKIILDNHPAGQPLPIVYTEIGRWMNAYLIDKEETMDSPSLFTEWAGIYTNNMKNGGYGMWAFKFANTTSGPYPLGIKSGHHYIWQGQRIVEDAYTNIALNKPVKASASPGSAQLISDGKKSAAWVSVADSTINERWVAIDLGNTKEIASAIVYTGSEGGVYTGPDRVKNFKLQYEEGGAWKDIPGTIRKDNKYTQVFIEFNQPVAANKVRFLTTDKGTVKVREVKLFAKGDGPTAEPDFNVSGIQRTGEVVRLFAKGFKNERPLFDTKASIEDANMDAQTSYDSITGNYYVWLVQRGGYTNKIKLDISALAIMAGTTVTAETVGPNSYGEVSSLFVTDKNNKLDIVLRPQTVMLLTIPSKQLKTRTVAAVADATVTGGKNGSISNGSSKQLFVALDASTPENNQVSYIRFDINGIDKSSANRILLKVYGHNMTDNSIFRFHVYGIPTDAWRQDGLNWSNAPWLDKKEALIKKVGEGAFVAGELAMNREKKYHYLDVTDLVKNYGGEAISFALVRETRQIGDDEDKGKKAAINSSESTNKPELIFYTQEAYDM